MPERPFYFKRIFTGFFSFHRKSEALDLLFFPLLCPPLLCFFSSGDRLVHLAAVECRREGATRENLSLLSVEKSWRGDVRGCLPTCVTKFSSAPHPNTCAVNISVSDCCTLSALFTIYNKMTNVTNVTCMTCEDITRCTE